MRMHSYGKCGPNLTIGVVTVFALIVLYNYWNVSTYNRDLLLKLHSTEQQAILMDRNNDALQGNYQKTVAEKSKIEFSLMEAQIAEKDFRKRIDAKVNQLQSVNEEFDTQKQETIHVRDELKQVQTKLESKGKEVTELKSKVVALETQLNEQKLENEKLQKLVKESEANNIGNDKPKLSSSSPSRPNEAPIAAPAAFLGDPAEQQMNPEAGLVPPPPAKDKDMDKENGGGEVNNEGLGVLPVPGGNVENGGNLDAAEDDGDHPLKEDVANQDDQSPDGALNPKDNLDSQQGVGPPPPPAAVDIKEPLLPESHLQPKHIQNEGPYHQPQGL